jgi:hypothetical protein
MRISTGILALVAVLAAPASATGSTVLAAPASATGSAASCEAPDRPLFGVARVEGGRVLAQIERRTLRPRARGRVPLPRGMTGWNRAFSPDCGTVALAGRRGGVIQLVNLERAPGGHR